MSDRRPVTVAPIATHREGRDAVCMRLYHYPLSLFALTHEWQGPGLLSAGPPIVAHLLTYADGLTVALYVPPGVAVDEGAFAAVDREIERLRALDMGTP